jgi:SAM-dependent methyltransferase
VEKKKDFEYKDLDLEGLETLSVISKADNFNRWMYETIKPYCKGKILEVGSGVGNISKYFLEDKSEILLTDIRDNYCEILRENFSDKPSLLGVKNIDLVVDNFEIIYKDEINQYDTVFALNVVEHIENDLLAIENCKKLLRTGGHLIILVPAYQALYNQFDKELFHYKRYVKLDVVSLFKQAHMFVFKSFYFNALGIAGWFVSGKLAKNQTIPSSQMSFYNKIVFLAKFIDFVLFKSIGLSTVVVGKKN